MKKGFTLIELLVVIAIIGILSSVVLASLSTARQKGADSRIQSQLQAMRAQAYLYTGIGNSYAATPCSLIGDTLFETGNNGLGNLLSSGITLVDTRCASEQGLPSDGKTWAVASITSTGAWCVDSTGVSRGTFVDGSPYTSANALEDVIVANTTVCA